MDTRVFCVYNPARGALLNSTLKIADNAHQPLKLLDQLISGLGLDSKSALWLQPVTSAPLVPRVFPFDFAYLDKDCCVLQAAEIGPGIDFPPYEPEVTSALILPSGRLLSSRTEPGDFLVICPEGELEAVLAARSNSASTDSTVPATSEISVTLRSTRKRTLAAVTPDRDCESPPSLVALAPSTSSDLDEGIAVAESLLLKGPASATISARSSPKSALEVSIENAIAAANSATSTPKSDPAEATVQGQSAGADQFVETKQVPEEATPDAKPTSTQAAISITEAVIDHPRVVPPATVEHHTDPEDFFSNWVVTPSGAPARAGENAFESTAASEPSPRTPQRDLEPVPKPNPAQPAYIAAKEFSTSGEAASASTSPLSPTGIEPAKALQPPTPPQPASPEPIQIPAASAQEQTPGKRIDVPKISSTNTISATPYSMWRVSVPTAVTTGSSVKSPPKPAASPSTESPKSENAASSAQVAKKPTPITSRPASAVAPPADTAKAAPAPPTPMRRSTDRPAESPARPTSAQFVSSVQERLERLQQSNAPAFVRPKNTVPPQPVRLVTERPTPSEPKPSLSATPDPTPEAKALQSAPVPPPISPPSTHVPEHESKTSPPVSQPKIKTEPPLFSLKSKFKKWFNPTASPSDRRRATRQYIPGMVAHYFTGGAPKPHSIADISLTGFYLLTEDRWMPGTMIQMTLQKPTSKGDRKQSITVLSRVVRRGSDGVATEFVMPGSLDPYSHDIPPSQATDKFALARFL